MSKLASRNTTTDQFAAVFPASREIARPKTSDRGHQTEATTDVADDKMNRHVRALKCRLSFHGSGLVGPSSPEPKAARSCHRCGKAWIGVYDGLNDRWRRVR